MKKLIGILVAVCALLGYERTLAAQTVGYSEFQSYISNGTTLNELHVYLEGKLPAKKLGWFSWSSVSKEWSQTYMGLLYAPTDYLTLEAGYGIETAAPSGRFGGSILLSKGPNSAYFNYENGGSGSWHKLVLNHNFTNWLGAGIMDQTAIGTGPRVEIRFKRLTAWGALLWFDNHPSTTIALDYNF